MLKELKRQFLLNRPILPVGLAASCGGGLAVMLIATLVARYDASSTALPPIGSILCLCIALLYNALMGIGTAITGDMCLKFGAVRRRLFPALGLMGFINCLVMVLVSRLWIFMDYLASRISGIPLMQVPLPWYWLGLATLAVTVLGLWIGALLMRYGKVAFWIVFAVYMVFVLFGTRVINYIAADSGSGPLYYSLRGLVSAVSAAPVPGLLLAGAAVLAALAGHWWFLLRRVAAR